MQHIDIKNIYWMLAYAFRNINATTNQKVSSESFENIYDLFSFIFIKELNVQIKRGLNKEYVNFVEDKTVVKGKILLDQTIKSNSLAKGKLVCEYDDYSINSYLNKIVKTAASYLLKSKKIKDELRVKKLKNAMIYFKDVDLIDKNLINWNLITYNRFNSSYKLLINISYLILDGLIVNNDDGSIEFKNYLDEQKMHKLYEKFILEYYKYHHKELNPSVTTIDWVLESNDFIEFLPMMKTDIVLHYHNKTLIIDAKYYSSIYQKNELFDKKTFHSNNLYQIFAYVKNYDVKNGGSVSGMLLYAKTMNDDYVDAVYNMSGNRIEVSNIDLSLDFECIKNKLETIAENFKNDNK